MNLSDPSGDDDSSRDESSMIRKYSVDETPVPKKRMRADTYGTSSTTSHGSVLQESDDEPLEISNPKYSRREQSLKRFNSSEASLDDNIRGSRSSLSETGSSPNDQNDDYRPTFENTDNENEESSVCFQETNENLFYKNQFNDVDDSYGKNYSEKSKRIMSSMGFKPGRGLGKREDGRVEPVEASTQKGRRGLGLKPSIVGNVPQNFTWSPDDAKPEAQEKVMWIPSAQNDILSSDQLQKWLKRGPKKLTIDDEIEFVQPRILKGVLDAKTIFDSLDDEDLRHARFRSNPYETIGSVMFLNRAAVKMANMDAVFDFMFTDPEKADQKPGPGKPEQAAVKEILYFADVCAGPGGFSEYVLYRKGWTAKGFGFTLKGGNDFKLSDFYAGTPETFHPFYGSKGDGNIFDPENLASLKDHVMTQTDEKGVHFLMADGGFSVEGQENIQEILSKQLYLCQCLAALMLVRPGGHFVVKLFDVFTLFSVGLVYIMYRCFDKVSIHKPVTSRPANSERYLICKSKKLGTDSAEHYLYNVNKILQDGESDVTEIVPLSVIQADTGFFEYIYESNCSLGEKQIRNLMKIAAFSKDRSLKEPSQAEMRAQCLHLWNLPDKVRTKPERHGPGDTLSSILTITTNYMEKKRSIPHAHDPEAFKINILNKSPEYLDNLANLNIFKYVYDWHFVFLSSGKKCSTLSIFIGCGGKQVFKLEDNGWKYAADLHLTLPAKTLIYGEIVKEYRGEGNTQIHTKALHIIDAMILGGRDISHLHLTERLNQCELFCMALNNPSDSQSLPIRCKQLFHMEQFSSDVNNIQYRTMKRVKQAVTINLPSGQNTNDKFYEVKAILFIKEIKEPWMAQMSKKSGYKYYFGPGKNNKPRSEYYIPTEAKLDMISAYSNRVMWPWEPSASAVLDGTLRNGVSKMNMIDYIDHNINRIV